MRYTPPIGDGALEILIGTLVVDFLLAAVFFASLAYATLGKRLKHTRAAAAISAVLGIALAIGLVWWEQDHGVSVRDLGPVALVLAIVFLVLAIFAAIRHAAGPLAAVGVAAVLGVLFGGMLGLQAPVSTEVATSLLVIVILISALALVFRYQGHSTHFTAPSHATPPIKRQVAVVRATHGKLSRLVTSARSSGTAGEACATARRGCASILKPERTCCCSCSVCSRRKAG